MASNQTLLLNIIEKTNSHPTAEDIFLQARMVKPRISLGTVYRNLNTLVDSGKIRRISTHFSPDRYDNTFPHDHLICMKCGKVVDIDKIKCTTENLPQGVTIDHFETTSFGFCPECAVSKNN